jgi:hypothetical protein
LTGEVGANFADSEAKLVTAMGGVTVKGRNYSYVQPSVRALVGGARERVTRTNVRDLSDVSLAYDLGQDLILISLSIVAISYILGQIISTLVLTTNVRITLD